MKQYIIQTIAAFVLGLQVALLQRSRGLVAAANTYDAAVETHADTVRRTNDAAVTARHLLWKKGAGDLTVALNGAADVPLGTIDNIETGTAVGQTVFLLGKGSTKKMVASGVIAAGARVYAADDGKVAATGTIPVGVALTAAAADDDILEVADGIGVTTPSGTSHKIVLAGILTMGGGAAAEAETVTGVAATDIVLATIVDNAANEDVVLLEAKPTTNTITFLFSEDPGAAVKVAYSILRAA